MDYREILEKRIESDQRILFNKKDLCIHRFRNYLYSFPREVIALWVLDMVEETVKLLEERYPNDVKPRIALDYAKYDDKKDYRFLYNIKIAMMVDTLSIISSEDIAHYYAVCQACLVVTNQIEYAIEYSICDLTAIIFKNGVENCNDLITQRIKHYAERLNHIYDKTICKINSSLSNKGKEIMECGNIRIDSIIGDSNQYKVTIDLKNERVGAHYIGGSLVDAWINLFKDKGVSLTEFFDSICNLTIINFDAFYHSLAENRFDKTLLMFLQEYQDIKNTYKIHLGDIYREESPYIQNV